MGKVIRLMTTSAKKKTAQTSRGEKKATGQIEEYSFFISGNSNGNDDAFDEVSRNEKASNNDDIELKRDIDFFLPE